MIRKGMTAVRISREGKPSAFVLGRGDDIEEVWATNGPDWVWILNAVNRGESLGYFTRSNPYVKDQPFMGTLDTDRDIQIVKNMIEVGDMRLIPLDEPSESRKSRFDGVLFVTEIKAANPKSNEPKVGSETKASDKDRKTGLDRKLVNELFQLQRDHNLRVRAAKRPRWASTDQSTLIAVYRRSMKSARPGTNEKGKAVTRHRRAMHRVEAFLEMLGSGKPKNHKYRADIDLLPEDHPWKLLDAVKRDIDADKG